MTCIYNQDGLMLATQASATFIDNQLLSTEQLSEYLNVPTATIRDWCYKRKIPFVKVGRHVRFRPSDVEKWLSERKVSNGY